MRRILLFFLGLTLLAFAACGPTTPAPTFAPPTSPPQTIPPAPQSPVPSSPATLTVMTHDSFAASETVIQAFEQENNLKLVFLPSGDTGAALNKAILSKDAPLADVFYGVDNTFLSRALDADLFEPYRSPLLDQIPPEFQLDPQNRVTPVDYGDVCINYDKAYFAEKNLPVPQRLEDLTKPEYKGLLVVENPATSSPGLAFLLATVAQFGDPGYL
ncbi:MAG: thiamine ABC transporter substrate-binding protein, partial [Anaerolineales bacterium]